MPAAKDDPGRLAHEHNLVRGLRAGAERPRDLAVIAVVHNVALGSQMHTGELVDVKRRRSHVPIMQDHRAVFRPASRKGSNAAGS